MPEKSSFEDIHIFKMKTQSFSMIVVGGLIKSFMGFYDVGEFVLNYHTTPRRV